MKKPASFDEREFRPKIVQPINDGLFAEQPELRPLVRHQDSDTSKEAAQSIADSLDGKRAIVKALFELHGILTDLDLERLQECSHWAASTARKRRTELWQAGILVKVGKKDGAAQWCLLSHAKRKGLVYECYERAA